MVVKETWAGSRAGQLGQLGPGAANGPRQAFAAPAPALAGTLEKEAGVGGGAWSRGQLQGL